MKFSQEFIQKIKDRVALSSVLSKHVKLIPAGHLRYKALCPFHGEKTPSFVISDDKANYHCFGCGAHGDVISFLEEKEGYSFVDAVKELAGTAGLALPQDDFDQKSWNEMEQEFAVMQSFQDFFVANYTGSKAEAYIKNRNLTSDVIKEFGLGYAPARSAIDQFSASKNYNKNKLEELGLYRAGDRGSYFFFAERLTFPIHNHSGKVVAYGGRILGDGQPKYINSPEHKFFKKRELLYNYFRAKPVIQKTKEVIVCEGYMDVIAMHQAGFANVVAPLGTAFSESHLETLWALCDNPTICLDGDVAGRKAMMRIADIAIPHLKPGKSLSFVVLPEGQDPDDVLKSGGKEAMLSLLGERLFLAEILVREHCREDLNTPEARSAAQEELKAIAYKIANENVKSQYLRYFKDAFFKFYRDKSYNFKTRSTGSELTITNTEAKVEEVELLVFVLTNHAALQQEELEEQFSLFEFSNESLTKIQEYLLQGLESFDIEVCKNWLAENIDEKLRAFLLRKISIVSSIKNDELDLKSRFEYLYKAIILARLKQDYQNNIRSEDESKQKLAIQLKHDITMLENELNNYLTS